MGNFQGLIVKVQAALSAQAIAVHPRRSPRDARVGVHAAQARRGRLLTYNRDDFKGLVLASGGYAAGDTGGIAPRRGVLGNPHPDRGGAVRRDCRQAQGQPLGGFKRRKRYAAGKPVHAHHGKPIAHRTPGKGFRDPVVQDEPPIGERYGERI